MKPLGIITGFVLVLLGQGCSLGIMLSDIEPTDQSSIRVGASLEEVEMVLGAPISIETTESGKIATYVYDKGALGKNALNDFMRDNDYGQCIRWLIIGCEPILIPIAIFKHLELYDSQLGLARITYGPDDNVVEYSFGDSGKDLITTKERQERRFRLREAELRYRLEHEQGDADDQYELSKLVQSPNDQWTWMCRAAEQGHGYARIEVARRYWYGIVPADTDRVRAFMWYHLAAAGGWERGKIEVQERRELLTSDEIVEAERLAKEWKTGDCETQLKATDATG